MSRVVCPVCEHDDQIQKVSAVVSGGVSNVTTGGPVGGIGYGGGHWSTVSGYSMQSGMAITVLAKRLMPPIKPSGRSSCWMWGCAIYLGLVAVMGFCGGILELFSADEPQSARVASTQEEEADPLAILFTTVIVGGIAGYLFYRIAAKRQRAQDQLPDWEQAVMRWNRVYYCFRDDLVFDPATGEACRLDDFYAFLYSVPKAKRQLLE